MNGPTWSFGFPALAAAALGTWGLTFAVPQLDLLVAWLAALGVTTFCVFGLDKSRARGSRSRVPENVLLGLALLGGTPGALVGMTVFRHKTSKRSFRIAMGLVVALQIGLSAWWLT